MKYLRVFDNINDALGKAKTPVVFYLNGAPKPMYASIDDYGDTCTIVIDDTEESAGIKPTGIIIIFRDDLGNIISKKEYKSGSTIEIPDAPVKAGYDFLGWGDVEIDKAVTNMTFIAQYEVTPKVTITMSDSYTDGSSIALNATKTETVTGELSFTTDLASDIAHIIDNVIIFDKHYEGKINITASALDKHSNIQSDSKEITVSCYIADIVECVVSNVTADDVEAYATSAIIKYDCNVTTTKQHDGTSNTVVAHKEKTVTFEANESKEDVTRSGSFTCEHGETVEWSLVQKKQTMPNNNQIWYKTNDGVVIVPSNMSPKTNEYTTKGVMTFTNNVTSIAQSAFASKSTLTEFYGGKSLTYVGSSAFVGCRSLTSIDLPNCSYVGNYAFNYCSSLTSVNLPNCTSVGSDAFKDCSRLTSVNLPNCSYVGYYAFASCISLTSVNLPNCSYVGSSAFVGCRSLTSVNLPNCTSVGGSVFTYCYSLTSIDLPNCSYVGIWAFASCTSLTSVNLPNCTSVGGGAFTYCSSLTSIDLPNCTYVGSSAFTYCSSLTSIDLPNCSYVGSSAFVSCSSLTSIDLPNCTSVGSDAFHYCSSLTSIDLPNCTYVGGLVFYSCYSLTSVNLPNCSYVGNSAFVSCSSLTSIDLPNCTSVGGSVFTYCSRLTSVNLPNCTSVGGGAFTYCSSLTSIDLTNCTYVGGGAFEGCRSLTSVNLPNCSYVGYYAFTSCTSLTTVTLGASTMCTLGNNNAFEGCRSLTSIYVPLSLVNIYKTNTYWSYFSDKIYPLYTPVTYKSLSITADDVMGRETTTIIHCTYLTDGVDIKTGDEITDIEIIEDVVSEPFDQNTSETETVERTITYSNHGLSAVCIITQGVWFNNECNIDLNSQWVDSTKSLSGYKVLMSNSNKGVDNGYASMKVEFTGIPDFKLYINSYAESSYDYTIAWNMDTPAPTSLPSDTTTGAKANTKGKQYNATSISNFTEVDYSNDGGTHYIWITYRKDSSDNSNDDRGYVAIPNEYFS